jgi:hypothetical protein
VFEPAAAGFGDKSRSQMSNIHAGLLVGVALIAMAAIGTLSLVVVTDVGYLAYRLLKSGTYPWARRGQSKEAPSIAAGGLRSARFICFYLSAVEKVLSVVFKFVPSASTVAMIATAMPAAIRPGPAVPVPGPNPILRPPIDQRYMAPAARSWSSGNDRRIFTFIELHLNTLEQRQFQFSST